MIDKNLWKLSSSLFISALLLSGCGWFGDSDTETDSPDTEVEAPVVDDDTDVEDPDTDDDTDVNSDTDETAEVSQDLTTWFPQLENVLLEFEGEGNEYASFTQFPQFAHENSLQMVESTAGTDVVTLYEYSDTEVTEVFTRPETYFREDFSDTELASSQDAHEITLQLPIEEGHSWESPTGTTSEITDIDVELDLPIGTVQAIEVTRNFEDNVVRYYYAEGYGLVQRVSSFGEDDTEVSSTLAAFNENQAEDVFVTIYTLDEQAMGIDAVPVTIPLNTNDPIRTALVDYMKGQAPDNEVAAIITEGVSINFMYLRDDGVAHVDFSTELTSEMNAGSGIEGMIVQAIVNTVGDYYGVQDVLLTVDGSPYASGHFELAEDETWPVDHSNVNP